MKYHVNGEEAFTPDEIAKRYKIPKITQAKLRMMGRFAPFVKIGRSVYVLKNDFEAWLAAHKRRSTIGGRDAA